MHVGMLWFDNDPRTGLADKVSRAADYYRKKYGQVPDLCMVHPAMMIGRPELVESRAEKIAVIPDRTILPGHLWIGCEEKN